MAQKFTQKETEEFMHEFWSAVYGMKEIEKIPSVISDDAVFIGFSPPRTVTYTGIEEMKKRFEEVWPVLGFSDLKVHLVDITANPTTSYHEMSVSYDVKVGPNASDSPLNARRVVYMDEKSGKMKYARMWDDPEVYVSMALDGKLPVGDLRDVAGPPK